VTSNGKASVYFDGNDNLINSKLAGQKRLDAFVAFNSNPKAGAATTLLSGGGSHYGINFEDGQSAQSINVNFGTPTEFINGTQLASNATRNSVYDRVASNKVIFSLIDGSTSSFPTFQMGWFNSAGSSLNFAGKISEMVFFPNMDSSPKRFPIEQNMMNHFEIYDHESDFSADIDGYSTDGTAMTFDTFTGNNDGIGGKNDVLRLTVDSSTGGRFHLKKGSIGTDTVTNYEVTFDYLTGGSGFNDKFWLLGTAFANTHGTKSEENAKIIADTTWRSVTLNGNLPNNGELYIKATTNTSLIVGDASNDNYGITGSSVAASSQPSTTKQETTAMPFKRLLHISLSWLMVET
jgi:hypothetical protein